MESIRTVLFDLDGTLADTAPDLKRAADHVLKDLGRRALTAEEAYRTAPLGMAAMLKASLGSGIGKYDLEKLKSSFLEYYRKSIHVETRLYPGITDILSYIREKGLAWGIVTNKPMFLTRELIETFPELASPAAVVAGDSVERHKPDPEPVLKAFELTGSAPGTTLMVGDALSDVESAVRAGARGALALWGYGSYSTAGNIAGGEFYKAATPLDLLPLIRQ